MTTQKRPTAGWLIAGLLMLSIVVWLGTLPPTVAGLIACGLLLYFLPWFVAWNRRHPNSLAIFVLNFFAGWTAIGWVVALVWACTAIRD